jgi:hypothetical protein
MFSLKIIDHIRLDAERVAQNYTVHATAAGRIARLITAFRVGVVALLALTVSANIANVFLSRNLFPAWAVGTALAALVGFAVYSMLGLESRLFAHRTFAQRLWLAAERYRSLLAEVNEGLVDGQALVRRRDELIAEVDAIYRFAFGVDHAAHENLRLPALPDQQAA